MKKVLIAFLCLVTLGVSWRMVRESLFGVPRDAPLLAPLSAGSAPAPKLDPLNQPAPPAPVDPEMGPEPKAWPWQDKLPLANDFQVLVHEAMPAAQGGDGDARFAIFNLFNYCQDGMRKRSGVPEALMQEVHGHCDALAQEYPDLEAQTDLWLKKSVEARFPRALVLSSLVDLLDMSRKPPGKKERERRVAAARTNALEALKANDPYVTNLIPLTLPTFFPGDVRAEQAEWVWKLAACEQGLDCGRNSAFVQEDCHARNLCMGGETGKTYIHRVAGEIPLLDSRARELARVLRKGTIDDKTFDDTVSSLPPPKSDLFAKSRAPRQAR